MDAADDDKVDIFLSETDYVNKYTDADITVADLGEDIFKNTLSTYTTKYDTTNTNRATNLEIAVNKINLP